MGKLWNGATILKFEKFRSFKTGEGAVVWRLFLKIVEAGMLKIQGAKFSKNLKNVIIFIKEKTFGSEEKMSFERGF